MKKKVLFVFGTRPEVIKIAPVVKCADSEKGKIEPIVCVTGQHRHLLDQALSEFDLKPDLDLDIMKPGQSLEGIVSCVMNGMKRAYHDIKPDVVLVQGDTSTVFAASLQAYYDNIPIGHIEAGLRSYDNRNPFPEEINRRFVSMVAEYNFCPTGEAKSNLIKESIDRNKIFVTGNTVIDALDLMLKINKHRPPAISPLRKDFLSKPYVLITGHRRENFGRGLENVARAIKELAGRHGHIGWLWVAHLNPRARDAVFKTLDRIKNTAIIEPVPYSSFVSLFSGSLFLISDSGGVQEEAARLGKTVLVTRICTERPEAINAGNSTLVGTDPERIIKEAENIIAGKAKRYKRNPFGDGLASRRVMDVLLKGKCKQFKG